MDLKLSMKQKVEDTAEVTEFLSNDEKSQEDSSNNEGEFDSANEGDADDMYEALHDRGNDHHISDEYSSEEDDIPIQKIDEIDEIDDLGGDVIVDR